MASFLPPTPSFLQESPLVTTPGAAATPLAAVTPVSTSSSRTKTRKVWQKKYFELSSTEFSFKEKGKEADPNVKSSWKLGSELISVVHPQPGDKEFGVVILLDDDKTTTRESKTLKFQTASYESAKDWAGSIERAIALALKRASPVKPMAVAAQLPPIPPAAEQHEEEAARALPIAAVTPPIFVPASVAPLEEEKPIAPPVFAAAASEPSPRVVEPVEVQPPPPPPAATIDTSLLPPRQQQALVPIARKNKANTGGGFFGFWSACCSSD